MMRAVLTMAFAAWPLSAQSGQSADSRMRPDSGTISVDELRHPINAKARRMLRKALEEMDSGDHKAAIRQLLETLAKDPDSAAYVHSLLGVEYLKTDRFADAVNSFDQAVRLFPHDAMNRYNLGLALVCAGDYERGKQELRRAIELDPKNASSEALLSVLEHKRRATMSEYSDPTKRSDR
ncbi:MAG: tetratricopeptide repeat protein [Bryobacteraceae bacterium]